MRSLEQIKQSMVDDILALQEEVRLVEGDTQYDVTVSAPANQFYRFEVLNEFEDRTRNLDGFIDVIDDESFKQTMAGVLGFKQDGSAYTIDDINDLISDRLDAYVADFPISRNSGDKAAGTIRVYLSDASVVSWDNSTGFTSKLGSTYVATSVISSVIPNFDSTMGLYYVDIPIEATVIGVSSNSSANAITAMDPAFSNFSYCRNLAAVDGGSDEETDLDLIARAQEALARRTNGSLGSYETLVEAQSYVDDAIALDEDDEEEDVYIGSVCDVFTQFSSVDSETVEQIVYWPGLDSNDDAESFDFTLTKQPVDTTVTPIVFKYTSAGLEEQIVPNSTATASDYAAISFVEDTSTYSGSTKANDKIRVDMKLNTDNYQRKLKLVYVYDKSPTKLQNIVNNSDNRMVGPNALVRKAVDIPIRIIVEVQITFGYVQETVEADIESNLNIFFNGGTTSFGKQYARKSIGEDISHTDIGTVVLRTEGVASYDTDTFFVVNTVTGDLSDPTTINDNQYASLHDVVFTYSTFALSNFTASFSE